MVHLLQEPHLFLHRSWTGQPVYRITLAAEGAGARAIESSWSKDLASAEHADPEYQSQLLDFLIADKHGSTSDHGSTTALFPMQVT